MEQTITLENVKLALEIRVVVKLTLEIRVVAKLLERLQSYIRGCSNSLSQ